MKKQAGIIVILMVLHSLLNGQNLPAWVNGIWEGTGFQLNSKTIWSIRFTPGETESRIDYPSLDCGGTWVLEKAEPCKLIFKEFITEGTSRCTNFGKVIITPVDETHISFSYYNPELGILNAFSTLEKIPEN